MIDTPTTERGLNFEPPEVVRELLRDPAHLPTHDEINLAFRPSKSSWLEWYDFCFDAQDSVYEFLNKEYLTALSSYLAERSKQLGINLEQPITILEVGAGSGRLSYFLGQMLEEKMTGRFKIIATDNGSQEIKPQFPVEKIDYKEALEKYRPTIVIASWMPYKVDWTNSFRAAESVQEYLLIGETDGGTCGDERETWGINWYSDPEEDENKLTPYQQDGFERVDLKQLSKYQICRTDAPGRYNHSRTASFRRKS